MSFTVPLTPTYQQPLGHMKALLACHCSLSHGLFSSLLFQYSSLKIIKIWKI